MISPSSWNAPPVIQLGLPLALFDQVLDVDEHRVLLHVKAISLLQQRHQLLVVRLHAGKKIVDENLGSGESEKLICILQ